MGDQVSKLSNAEMAQKIVALFDGEKVSNRNALAVAQARATLALVEQQRMANLVAYWAAMTNESFAYLDDEAKAMFRGVQEQIEKGLTLA